ncbi:MAG: FAD-binding oxidoreductase [Terriglobia bacterium]
MIANPISGTEMIGRTSEEALRAIVGIANVRPGEAGDAVQGVPAPLIIEPASGQELAAVLRYANQAGLCVAPRGGGTKLGWGNPPSRLDLILSTARLNHVVEHAWADLTVTVEAGCTLHSLQEKLAQHGQRLALDALWPEQATVGGALSTNDSGALRLRFGGLRDLVIGITLALPDGTLATSGGKVVKNVAGYDLPKLATGALGTLGVITRAIFRLHPLPQNTRTLSIAAKSLPEMQRFVASVRDSQLAPTALQMRFRESRPPQADILFEGTLAGLAAQEVCLKKLAEPNLVSDAGADVWMAREQIWTSPAAGAIAKISVLPAGIAKAVEEVQRITPARTVQWSAVVQATGIGSLRLDGAAEDVCVSLGKLRASLERDGGSLSVLRHPSGAAPIEAWGNPGDALALMSVLKKQFDPMGTLNRGRFVGAI